MAHNEDMSTTYDIHNDAGERGGPGSMTRRPHIAEGLEYTQLDEHDNVVRIVRLVRAGADVSVVRALFGPIKGAEYEIANRLLANR